MKKYIILESWNNGCDNGENCLYATCDSRADAKELLYGLGHMMMNTGSLGEDYGQPEDGTKVHTAWYDIEDTLYAWTGTGDCKPFGSEFRRIFRIVEQDAKWDFVHERESLNPAFYGFFIGLVSNGSDFLFYRASREDNLCEVFGSIEEMCQSNSEDLALCSYPWTAENDSLLLSVLNANPFGKVYAEGTCDQSQSILHSIQFTGAEEGPETDKGQQRAVQDGDTIRTALKVSQQRFLCDLVCFEIDKSKNDLREEAGQMDDEGAAIIQAHIEFLEDILKKLSI